jgi:hypothetical protein
MLPAIVFFGFLAGCHMCFAMFQSYFGLKNMVKGCPKISEEIEEKRANDVAFIFCHLNTK